LQLLRAAPTCHHACHYASVAQAAIRRQARVGQATGQGARNCRDSGKSGQQTSLFGATGEPNSLFGKV
jgi:hypothetical protein